MRKTHLLLAGTATAAAVISGTTLVAAGAPPATTVQTIILKATTTSLTCLPVPGQKPNGGEVPGDQCLFSAKLVRNAAPYGHDAVHCAVVTSDDLVCTAGFMLPGGQVTAAGDAGSPSGTVRSMPIVGGTGSYHDAQGDVVITSTGANTSRVVLQLQSTP